MVLVDSDDDEERKLLLSESPSLTNSPVITKELIKEAARGSRRHQEAAKEARQYQLLPRLAWTAGPSMEADKLRLGAAEEQFLAMTGGVSDGCDDDNDDDKDDDENKVPDSLQVVSSILSELDADILSERPSESGQASCRDTCTCALPPHKLVVDVHSQGGVTSVTSGHSVHNVSGGRCREHGKHTTDRVAAGAGAVRCHTEADRQLAVAVAEQHRNDQLDNCDRIETVGEERSRHMSESALGPLHWSLGRRKRAATLCTSPRTTAETAQARQSAISNATNLSGLDFGSGLDIVKHCRSTDTLGGEVKFDIWEEADLEMEEGGLEHLEGRGDAVDSCEPAIRGLQEEFDSPFPQHPLVTELYNCYTMPGPPGMSHSSSTSSMPICRICQLPSLEPHNSLISPCRCLGSIRYVHNPCLAKWLEVCSRKTGDPPVCELCQYQYIRHKKFVISNWRVPSISSKDRVLHSVFLLSILVMIVCSVATILSFKQADTLPKVGPDTELSSSELLTLSCGVFFFFSFFVAMYVEVKAECTIYQLICKFFQMNHEWTILEYDRARDRIKKDTVGIKGSFP